MAHWCIDRTASALTGTLRFRRPYPQDGYRDDRRWNSELLDAMQYVTQAGRVFEKDPAAWGKEENAFYREMVDGIAEYRKRWRNDTI